MDDSIKHSNDEEVCAVTYTWGQVKTFLKEHGRCATDANAEALLAECGCGNIEGGKDNLFCDAYDEIEQCLYTSLTTASLPDKPWYDRPNGVWVYNREKPADYHDDGEDEPWYGTYCHIGKHSSGNQCWCCNTCSQCGRHMCEACTVRCSTCGSIVCNNDASETKDGEWECVECVREHDPEKSRLLDALENYQGTIRSEKAESERRIIIGFIDSLPKFRADEINRRLGDARNGIRRLAKERKNHGNGNVCVTPDGTISYEQLATLAERNGYATVQTFADRLVIMYDGTEKQRQALLDDWDDYVAVAQLEDDVEYDNRNRSTDFEVVYRS
uniref:hypothetical protein n=1 Tax=Bifidobacterium adolescentis TaxID=1680 RepID=UPI00399AE476